MFGGTLDRFRRRRQGIGKLLIVFYGFVWLVRKLSAGTVLLDYRYILVQGVPEESMLKGRAHGKLEVRTLEGAALKLEEDRDRNGAFSREPRDKARFLQRVEQGDVCIAAMRENRAEGVLWLSFGTYDEPDVKANFAVNPQHGMAWDSNLYIVEDARGGFIFAALWDGANSYLRDKAYRWTATQTSAFNGPSLQAHARMGARRIARILYVCIGPAQLNITSLRPRFCFLRASAKAPVYPIPVPHEPTD